MKKMLVAIVCALACWQVACAQTATAGTALVAGPDTVAFSETPEGIYAVGESLLLGAVRDTVEGLNLVQRSADMGYPAANYLLGYVYLTGLFGVDVDTSLAVDRLTQASRGGDHESTRLLAALYFAGYGVSQDRGKAVRLLDAASAAGDEAALKKLEYIADNDTLRLYSLQFRILPRMVEQVSQGEYGPSLLTDVTGLRLNYALAFFAHYEWDWNDFKAEEAVSPQGRQLVVYTFAEPAESPYCKYTVACRSSDGSGTWRYYTLERMIMGGWIFCGATTAGHHNYGKVLDDCDLQSFVKLIDEQEDHEQEPPLSSSYSIQED